MCETSSLTFILTQVLILIIFGFLFGTENTQCKIIKNSNIFITILFYYYGPLSLHMKDNALKPALDQKQLIFHQLLPSLWIPRI